MAPNKTAPAKARKKALSKSGKAPAKAGKKAVKFIKTAAKKTVKKAAKKVAGKVVRAAAKVMKAAVPPAPSPNTVFIPNVKVGLPFLRKGVPAEMFTALRQKVIREAGFDFLSVFGDMMRPRNF